MPGGPEGPAQVEHVDALVVGSGFGGSVAAFRLAAGGRSVAVFERGRAYPPGSFARTPAQLGKAFWDPSEALYGLYDAWSFAGTEGVVSAGLGGGSLIYANVLLRKDPEWFVHDSPVPGGGYENWPFSRADLDPHYDAVEAMLTPTPYPYSDTLKTQALQECADTLGLDCQRPPLAVSFSPTPQAPPGRGLPLVPAPYGNLHGAVRQTCTLCGECDLGCNTGSKNTLDHTYLSAAADRGADLRTLHEVRGFRPLPGGGYEVRYVVHHDDGQGVSTRKLPERVLHCTRLVLAAGTFGTTFLLLRSRASLPGLSSRLGTRFSGNGDLLTLLLGARTQQGAVRPVDGSVGPVITSAIRVPDRVDGGTGRGYYVEDAGYPAFANWLIETGQLRSVARRTTRLLLNRLRERLHRSEQSNVSAALAAVVGDGAMSSSSLPLLGMGRDVPDGVMSLHDGRLAVDWTLSTSTAYFTALRQTMEDIGGALGARFSDNPLWWAKRVITVHPLGGAPVGRHPGEGVCDPYGEVFGFPGLHVLDGSAMPGPVGANPALTIAALSDRACDRMLTGTWGHDRRPAPHRSSAPATGEPNQRSAAAQSANAQSANAQSANAQSANAQSANAQSANAQPTNAESTAAGARS